MVESWATTPAVRAVMRANRCTNTKPEMRIRRLVHAAGLRYRVNARPESSIRATADLLFTRAKLAVFIDGCFWHGCAEHYRPATLNAAFWADKIAMNRARDERVSASLMTAGWAVLRVWEHEDPEVAAQRIARALKTQPVLGTHV